MPHVLRRQGILAGTGLAVFLALVHTVNDAITAILGAMLPALQERFQADPTLLAVIVAVHWIASSVTQPIFGALAEELGLRLVGMLGVLFAALFLSLIGIAPELVLIFMLLVIGGMGSAALHLVGTTPRRWSTCCFPTGRRTGAGQFGHWSTRDCCAGPSGSSR
jgi:MFS transporter, FSR family, fosmidomycin resistance protein